jgi:hypothetical protein
MKRLVILLAAAVLVSPTTHAQSGPSSLLIGLQAPPGQGLSGNVGPAPIRRRTNLVLQSGDFTQANYTKAGLGIALSGAAPDGSSTASLVTEITGGAGHYFYGTGYNLVAGTTTVSIFIKAGTQRFVSMRGEDTTGGGSYPWITLDTQVGTVNANGAVLSSGANALPGGFYRMWLTWTARANAGANMVIAGSNVAAAPATASITGTVYAGTSQTWTAWGLQAETGGFPSNYIPTTTAPVTAYLP